MDYGNLIQLFEKVLVFTVVFCSQVLTLTPVLQ